MTYRSALSLSLSSLLAAAPALAQENFEQAAQKAFELEALTITATRGNTEVGQTPQKITIITREEIETQLAITSDQAAILSNLIPAFTPSRQKLTGSGETFRGREPLFLLDGVPQSNPLRNGARDGYTIDFSLVERIEVIHGASAEHGLGATGGIINFITRRPESGKLTQHAGISVSSPLQHESDSEGYKLNYRIDGSRGDWDFLLGGTYQSRGLFHDANGEPIGVDNIQGDTMDSESHDILAKVGYWLDNDQNIELTLNRFFLEGDHDYVNIPGDRSLGIPATSAKGDPEGDAPRNEVFTASLSYRHDDLFGNRLGVQLYRQEFEGRFGGGKFGIFQDPAIAPAGTLFDQSQNESEKTGAKITVNRDGLFDDRLKLTGGVDVLHDETRQTLIQTDREFVPETEFFNVAPFLQAEIRPMDRLTLQAGARYEHAELDVDSFRTIAGFGGGVEVDGGSPSFSEMLYNAGAVVEAAEGVQLFANYSEGFGMPDVGRLLRGISQPGLDVDDFLDLEPILTDNREIGIRVNRGKLDLEVSYFESDSDLGSRLVEKGDVFQVKREKTEIQGVEAELGLQIDEIHRTEASFANINGKFDSDGDGDVDQRLGGMNISPDQFTLRWLARWNEKLNSQIQAKHFFQKDSADPTRPELDFDGYTVVDAAVGYSLPVGRLHAGVENLFDEDYFTYYSQTVPFGGNSNFYKGRGRFLTVGYDVTF